MHNLSALKASKNICPSPHHNTSLPIYQIVNGDIKQKEVLSSKDDSLPNFIASEPRYSFDEIILSYGDETIIDGHFSAPMVFKVVFDGMNVISLEYLNITE